MDITVAHVSPHTANRAKEAPFQALIAEYLSHAAAWSVIGQKSYPSEPRLLEAIAAAGKRTHPIVCLLDQGGRQLSSERFAAQLAQWRDSSRQQLFCCVGPADGWSAAARRRADLVLSLGPMTLPHTLARVVLAEQLYRALSILASHPYHCRH